MKVKYFNHQRVLYPLLMLIMVLIFLCATLSNSYANKEYHDNSPALPNLTKFYKAYWMGMHVGDIISQISQDKNGAYYIESRIQSRGIAKRFLKYWSVSKSLVNIDDSGNISSQYFFTKSATKRKTREINLSYDEAGNLAGEEVIPPDNRKKRPFVEDDLKYIATDPHSIILVSRKKIKESLDNNISNFSIPVYDGRRLTNVDFNIIGKKNISYNSNDTEVIHVIIQRQAISGYTEREIKRMETENPPINIYLENNDTMLPLIVRAKAPIGSAYIRLVKECVDINSCHKPATTYVKASDVR